QPRSSVLAAGASLTIAANCTDLFLGPPDQTTRFSAAAGAGQAQLADGSVLDLREALDAGQLVLRGRAPGERAPWNPYLLQLYLSNPGPDPVRVSLRAGTLLSPVGRSLGEVPEGMPRLLSVKGAAGQVGSRPLACAVWAARG